MASGRCYKYIKDAWKASANDSRAEKKFEERTEFIAKGALSAKKEHMESFVAKLTEFNTELHGTDYAMKDTVKVNTVLTALQKHNKSLVTSYKATKAGVTDWNKSFVTVWNQIKELLESDDAADDLNAARTTADVLATKAQEDSKDKEIAALKAQLAELKTTVGVLATNARRPPPTSSPSWGPEECDLCGGKHRKSADIGCVGEAVATGKMTKAAAIERFRNVREPEKMINAAVKKYTEYQAAKKGTTAQPPPQGTAFKPTKSIVLMTTVDDGSSVGTRGVWPEGHMNYPEGRSLECALPCGITHCERDRSPPGDPDGDDLFG